MDNNSFVIEGLNLGGKFKLIIGKKSYSLGAILMKRSDRYSWTGDAHTVS